MAHFASSPSGQTNNELGIAWLITIFNYYTKAKARHGRDWQLLFIDGHSSHVNIPFLDWCLEYRILVVVYPPYLTYRLQPLDVSLFNPLVNYYSQELNKWIYNIVGLCRIIKREFYGLFQAAWQRAFIETNILSGWCKTGLQPLNLDLILNQVKPAAPKQPGISGSALSMLTIYSASNIRQVRRLVKHISGTKPLHNMAKLGNLIEKIAAKNSILQA